ncbi:MAG: hypothetical protein MMC23_004038 [Stictis urceolatum]|nr:hypothetical protein [Stictis urceolata]
MSTSALLSGCVTSLQSSIQLLGSSISILDTGVNDFPRLSKVLQTTRVCVNSRPTLHLDHSPQVLPTSAPASALALYRTTAYAPPSRLTADHPQHFELLPESTLQSAQTSLLASITPEIQSLLSRVETHLERLQRREQTLRAKSELLAGRLGEQSSSVRPPTGSRSRRDSVKSSKGKVQDEESMEGESLDNVEAGREALRMKQLRQKKERLSFAVERLTLQAQQRERQLRMSMARGE